MTVLQNSSDTADKNATNNQNPAQNEAPTETTEASTNNTINKPTKPEVEDTVTPPQENQESANELEASFTRISKDGSQVNAAVVVVGAHSGVCVFELSDGVQEIVQEKNTPPSNETTGCAATLNTTPLNTAKNWTLEVTFTNTSGQTANVKQVVNPGEL